MPNFAFSKPVLGSFNVAIGFRRRQEKSEIVDVSSWELDEEFPYYPQGKKPKQFLICPSPAPHQFLIGGHKYLFKKPIGWKAQQIWSEVLAYEFGRVLDIQVPPAFVAQDGPNGSAGVLVEFFFGYQNQEPPSRFVHAAEILQGRRGSFSEKIGSIRENLTACRSMGVANWREWWTGALTFDALIGNTDRHSENWGFLVFQGGPEGRSANILAPVFDNGTSLGWQTSEEKFPLSQLDLARFVNKGVHHCGWFDGDENGQHIALVRHLAETPYVSRQKLQSMIQLSDDQISEVTDWATAFDMHLKFSTLRAEFVNLQVIARRDGLKQALENVKWIK